uniref:CCHC-type domain-containing protein n=1 Tax=Plectus sambesii TaxID=2011161 RepID=A0A914X6F6_9BILA
MASASRPSSPVASTPSSNPASDSLLLARLFQQQQEENVRQFQLLAEKIAATKRPRERSPARMEKTRAGDWHRVFNSRCVKLLDQLLETESVEETREGLLELQQRLKQRNFDLEMNDTHPGYLMFKDKQADIEELKEQGIDDSYLVAFKKQRPAAGPTRPLKERRQPFLQRGAGGSGGAGAAQRQPLGPPPGYGVAPSSYVASGGAMGAGSALFQPQVQYGNFGHASQHGGFGSVAPSSLHASQQSCHHCKQHGHYKRNCPYLLKFVGDRAAGPLPPTQ